jgi:hypothetical protein
MTAESSFLDQVNAELASGLEADARYSREKFLEYSGRVLRGYLEIQALDADTATTGDNLELHVSRDIISSPTAPTGVGPICLSFMMEGRNVFQDRDERLRILVPAPKDFNPSDPEAITELPEPDEVYVERSLPPKEGEDTPTILSRYAITRQRSFPYVLHDGDEILEDTADSNIELFFTERLPEELTRLVRLRLDMKRFSIKPQRSSVVGSAEITDL